MSSVVSRPSLAISYQSHALRTKNTRDLSIMQDCGSSSLELNVEAGYSKIKPIRRTKSELARKISTVNLNFKFKTVVRGLVVGRYPR